MVGTYIPLILIVTAALRAAPARAVHDPTHRVEVAVQPEVGVGDDLTFVVSVRGPSDETTVEDHLPAGLVGSGASATQGSCATGPPVTCTLGPIGAEVVARATIIATAVRGGSIENPLTVTTTEGGIGTAHPLVARSNVTGPDCTLIGTQGDDQLGPGAGPAPVVCGLGGRDLLRAGPDGDTLAGGAGSDTLLGGKGRDVLRGGGGPDTLVGGPGRDYLDGGPARDACFEGSHPRLARKTSCEARAFATSRGITLFATSRRPAGFGFHEALFFTARPMKPRGRLVKNDNHRLRKRFPRTDGHRYTVMASRGRSAKPTTAIDIAQPRKVLSPVNGTVEWVRRYRLYCTQWDWKVAIRPLERPSVRVLVLHLAKPTVRRGQRVTASVTKLGKLARNDPPWAQENRYFLDRFPHVHIEVERRGSPKPPCSA